MESKSLRNITSVWIITVLVLFVLAIVMGITLRFNQAHLVKLTPVKFYSTLTAHGMTMIGIWSVAGLAAVHFLLSRYVKVSARLNIFVFILTVVGVVMLWLATFLGNFHAGWTFLYPLPFFHMGAKWATPLFLGSLSVLSVAWLIWTVGMMAEILKKYSLFHAFAWQHLSRKQPKVETPPFIVISMVTLVGFVLSLITALILLAMLFAEYYGVFVNDPLLMKNLIFFFGHTVANEALYLGVAVVYELMPEVSGQKKFRTTWYVAAGWNATMVFVLTAFFHHMYMDFVQPVGLQMVGQFASYFASLPAASVTAFSVGTLVFRNKIRWSMANILFFLGVLGWMVGGIGAVIDSTISNNVILHNTLWVPAHFHTYNAMGNVLFCLGFFWWAAHTFTHSDLRGKMQKLTTFLLLVGGFGFVLMFYLGGGASVPRRFAVYPEGLSGAELYASLGGWFAIVYLIAVLLMFGTITQKCVKSFSIAP